MIQLTQAQRPIMMQLAQAQRVIMLQRRSRHSTVLGIMNESPTGSPVVGEA